MPDFKVNDASFTKAERVLKAKTAAVMLSMEPQRLGGLPTAYSEVYDDPGD